MRKPSFWTKFLPFVSMLAAVQSLADEGSAGSLSLPGAHRTLAGLLREAEDQDATPSVEDRRRPKPAPTPNSPTTWKWELEQPQLEPNLQPGDTPGSGRARPQAVQAPAPVALMDLTQLSELIQQRNTAVDACNLFKTLKEIVIAEQQLRQLVASLNNAVAKANAAIANANMLNHPGANQVSKTAKQKASRAARNAQERVDAAKRTVQAFYTNTAQPLYEKIQPHIGDWTKAYRKMRGFVTPRRTDPNRQAVLDLLEHAIRDRKDFFEGRILAACCLAYQGQLKPCHEHLDEVIDFIDAHSPSLFPTLAAHDCAVACIVAGVPAKVTGFIRMVDKLPTPQQSAHQQWVVACYAAAMRKDSMAGTYYRRALAKVDAFVDPKPNNPAEPVNAILAGDAAHFFLTRESCAEADVDKFAKVIARAIDGGEWQLARARASLDARRSNWPSAQREITSCLNECPVTLEPDVLAEQAAYSSQTLWTRGRKTTGEEDSTKTNGDSTDAGDDSEEVIDVETTAFSDG